MIDESSTTQIVCSILYFSLSFTREKEEEEEEEMMFIVSLLLSSTYHINYL